MRFKKIGAALLACAMCFGVFSTTAFAYVDESVATEEPAVEEKVPETEPEEPMLPLTPDGNLTLVDDAGSPTKSGKQFITAVTKKAETTSISSLTVMIGRGNRAFSESGG